MEALAWSVFSLWRYWIYKFCECELDVRSPPFSEDSSIQLHPSQFKTRGKRKGEAG